ITTINNNTILHESTNTHNILSNTFFNTLTAPHQIYTLSLHDALPISREDIRSQQEMVIRDLEYKIKQAPDKASDEFMNQDKEERSEEHTSELQSRFDLVCRLLLEKKKITQYVRKPHSLHRT